MEKIRVFIGTEDAQALPTEVCKWSILSRSESEFEFFDLKELSLKLDVEMHTGFSFFRFAIPEKCGYEGRAIYMDADQIAFDDLKKLYEKDMGGKGVLGRPLYNVIGWDSSVMLMDCAKLKHWDINKWATLINMDMMPYKETIYGGVNAPNHQDFGSLEPEWNHWDQYDETTKIIHYTTVGTQPWKVPGHKHEDVFLKELKSAIDGGFITKEFVQKEIDAGHAYPELLQKVT